MAKFEIQVTEEAAIDLSHYPAFERKIVVAEIRAQLAYEPTTATKNRKPLRDNVIAPWELRIGKYRVFYEPDEGAFTVTVVSIGHKEHNVLFMRGREVRL